MTLLASLFNGYLDQGLKHFPSSSPVQVDFLAGQVINFVKLTCPISKGLGRLCSKKIINLDEQEVTLGKQHLGTTCPKNNLKF